MDALQEKVVINQDNRVFMAKELIKSSKLVMYYFSATWCAKWLYFVPKMKKVYEEGKKRKCGLEVIFVSLDNDNPTMMKHFKAQGNWYALVFGDDSIRDISIVNLGVLSSSQELRTCYVGKGYLGMRYIVVLELKTAVQCITVLVRKGKGFREMIYRYNITYLPCAIVVTPEGLIVTKNGISEVEELGINVLVTWSY